MESVYVNASGADIFFKINLVKDGSTECVLETIQCKHEQATKKEEKQQDLPLCMITTGPSNNFVLPVGLELSLLPVVQNISVHLEAAHTNI